jgi:hypothetical protein
LTAEYSTTQEGVRFRFVMPAVSRLGACRDKLQPASRFSMDSGLKTAGMTTQMPDTLLCRPVVKICFPIEDEQGERKWLKAAVYLVETL